MNSLGENKSIANNGRMNEKIRDTFQKGQSQGQSHCPGFPQSGTTQGWGALGGPVRGPSLGPGLSSGRMSEEWHFC